MDGSVESIGLYYGVATGREGGGGAKGLITSGSLSRRIPVEKIHVSAMSWWCGTMHGRKLSCRPLNYDNRDRWHDGLSHLKIPTSPAFLMINSWRASGDWARETE